MIIVLLVCILYPNVLNNLKNYKFLSLNNVYNQIFSYNYTQYSFVWITEINYFKKTGKINMLLPNYFTNTTFRILNFNWVFKNLTNYIILIYTFTKTMIISLLVSIGGVTYACYYFNISFIKQLAVWLVISFIIIWLFSGFNFFLKRYRFGKFTSAIQRFWKRTNMCFWFIEGFLFIIFFYYYLNSSQEPLFMYDSVNNSSSYLFSGMSTYANLVMLAVVIYYLYILMLSINNLRWAQIVVYIFVASLCIFYTLYIETYQFYYVISSFSEKFWILNVDDLTWSIEAESPRLRAKHQYFLMCLIAKYWHFLFIFLSWVFFIIKCLELRRVSYVLLGVNIQNLLILYVLNLLCLSQYMRWIFRRFFDSSYFWMFTDSENTYISNLIGELYNLSLTLIYTNQQIHMYSLNYLNLFSNDIIYAWKYV